MKNKADNGDKKAALVISMSENFDKLLSVVLIGNNIVNIVSTSIATILFVDIIKNENVATTVSTLVMTVTVLIFGEVTPKSLAKESPESFAKFAAPFLCGLSVLFTPFVAFFVTWKKILNKIFKSKESSAITGDELITIVDEAEQGGEIGEEEGDLLRAAIEFYEQQAGNILTPRVDLVAVSIDDTIGEIEQTFLDSGFSRLPVYNENIDNITGVLHHKDFHKKVCLDGVDLKSAIKPVVFVAKQIMISDLLRLLQKDNAHMAVVVDEYGGTMGIVTLEDILEELVGEIWDEHDDVINESTEISETSFSIFCSMSLVKFFDKFDIEADPEEFTATTVGGWVLEQMGKIPDIGDSFVYENLKITLKSLEDRRLVEILVDKIEFVNEEN